MGTQAPTYEKLKAAWAERRERVLRLMELHGSPSKVGKLVGLSPSRVCHIVKRAKS